METQVDQSPFATQKDFEASRLLHRKHGTTYYFATQRFRPEIRRRVHALYGFVRIPDEWVDNPGFVAIDQQREQLRLFRGQLVGGMAGIRPEEPSLRAFCDVMREVDMPLSEPLVFLDAMEMDLEVQRYASYEDLRGYMRGSASAVGVMMCYILGVGKDPEVLEPAMALGEAMQLTNFLRDVGEDLERGRIYLPLNDLQQFGIAEADLFTKAVTPEFVELMQFEIRRARALYEAAESGISKLPKEARAAVELSAKLYSRILLKIEQRGYDVFSGRARTSRWEKVLVATQTLLGRALS